MKKEVLISILLLSLGVVFECLYYAVDNTFFDVKFYLLGIFSIIFGAIGLWVYLIMPYINKQMGEKSETN